MGYGGTKEEMERLIEDANRLKEANGEMADLSISSFANIVEAIHLIQVEMDISGISFEEYTELVESGAMSQEEAFAKMGTTAKESASTIQGSLSMMQSAWQNLMTGIANSDSDLDGLISDLVDSVTTFAENILPAVETALDGIGELIVKLAPIIVEALPGLTEKIIPPAISAAINIVNGIIDILPDMLKSIVLAIEDNAQTIFDAGAKILNALIRGINENYKMLIDTGLSLILELAKQIVNNLPLLLQTAFDIILYLVESITSPTTLNALIDAAKSIINSLVSFISNPETLGRLLNAAFSIIEALIQGLFQLSGETIRAAIKIVNAICEYFAGAEASEDFEEAGEDIVTEVLSGALKAADDFGKLLGKALYQNFKDAINDESWKDVGLGIIPDVVGGMIEDLEYADHVLKDWLGIEQNDYENKLIDEYEYNKSAVSGYGETGTSLPNITPESTVKPVLPSITPDDYSDLPSAPSVTGSASGKVQIVQNIYSQSQSAADLMSEALYAQERSLYLSD